MEKILDLNKLSENAKKFVCLKDKNINEIKQACVLSKKQEKNNYQKDIKEIEEMVKDLL